MFDVGDIIDDAYIVTGLCSDQGGMGIILYVDAAEAPPDFPLVLKYCRAEEEEPLKRFRREVRLLASFKGNSKVVQIYDYNLDYDPPYFLMKYYPDGDLLRNADLIQSDIDVQENMIIKIIDCIQELHSRNKYHRDIKPQNFLVDGEEIVVSDFGLTTEFGSHTAFTRSSAYWGTYGYLPPEFLSGGFKHANAASDIFMIGKTIYNLVTKRDPQYLVSDGIKSPIFHVIERCCSITKEHRYQTLSDLKQSLVSAYDVLSGRLGGIAKVKQLLSSIEDRLEQKGKYRTADVLEFIEQLSLLDEKDQIKICFEIPKRMFSVMRQAPFVGVLETFLSVYERHVESRDYSWSYAEHISSNMQAIFLGTDVPLNLKAIALNLAINAAEYMNRFAAMDTCTSMIKSITDDEIGLQVASVIINQRDGFVANIEPSECNCESIKKALRNIRND